MTKQEAIKNILQSQEFLDVMKEMKDNQIQTIIYSNDEDKNIRENAYIRIRTINEIMANLESISKSGEIKDKAWKIF